MMRSLAPGVRSFHPREPVRSELNSKDLSGPVFDPNKSNKFSCHQGRLLPASMSDTLRSIDAIVAVGSDFSSRARWRFFSKSSRCHFAIEDDRSTLYVRASASERI